LYDGIGELDATAAFEVYSQSAAAGTLPLATTDTIRTRHGLVLLTTSLNHAPALSRVVVPGAATLTAVDPRMRAWADRQQVPVEPLASSSGTGGTRDGSGGFSAALQNLASHSDAATTTATAKMIGYPTSDLDLAGDHRAWRPVMLGVGAIAIAILMGRVPALLRRHRCH
jgi:hypothetical protein